MTSREQGKSSATTKKGSARVSRTVCRDKSLTRASSPPKRKSSAAKSHSAAALRGRSASVTVTRTPARATGSAKKVHPEAKGEPKTDAKGNAKGNAKDNVMRKRWQPARVKTPSKLKQAMKRRCTKCKIAFRDASKQKAHKKKQKGAPKHITNEELVKCLRAVLEAVKSRIDSIEVSSPKSASSSGSSSSLQSSDSTPSVDKSHSPVPASSFRGYVGASATPHRLGNSTSKKTYVCPVCRQTFPWLCLLKRHLLTHDKVKVLRCPHCCFMTLKPHLLTEHLLTHEEREEGIRCKLCDEEFSCNSSSRQQSSYSCTTLSRMSSEAWTPPSCPSSPPNSPLAPAGRGAQPIKMHVCPVCNQSFRWLCVLKNHLRAHKDTQIFSCSMCPFVTIHPDVFMEHVWTHEKGGPYRCDLCDAEFVCVRHLMRHINLAHGYRSDVAEQTDDDDEL